MSKDLKIVWDTELMTGDLGAGNGDLLLDNGIETAVIISLFTDRRASDDDPLLDDNNLDKRGWWGDLVSPDVEGDQIGSKLWLIDRAKTTNDIIQMTKQYLDDALQWLVDDGVASKVDTYVERQGTPGNDQLAYLVTIYKNDGREVNLNYGLQWTEV